MSDLQDHIHSAIRTGNIDFSIEERSGVERGAPKARCSSKLAFGGRK